MRCYLMRHGHIQTVEFLQAGPDAELVEQGKARFDALKDGGFDSFEVWDGVRPLYRYPDELSS